MSKVRVVKRTDANNNNNSNYESDSDAESICDQDFERKVDVGLLVEEDDEMSETERQLGRLLLRSPFFPSKIGGKPAWLDYANLPASALACDSCKGQLTFLVQIYAPISADDPLLAGSVEDAERTFHRVLFVFICSSETCTTRTVRALRSQLRHENEFYSTEPPPSPANDDDEPSEKDVDACAAHLAAFYRKLHEAKRANLCAVCGVPAAKRCAKCSVSFYCSQAHQVYDWSKLNHKGQCAKYAGLLDDAERLTRALADDECSAEKYPAEEKCAVNFFPEYELSIEPEYLEDIKLTYKAEKALKIDEKKIAEDLEKNQGMDQDLDDLKETDQDRDFDKFKKFTQHEPNQVVRYERGGRPLWVTKARKLRSDADVPACQNCGAKRIFEFQVNPQLLNYLKLDESKNSNTVDWAGLYVYTCPRSCNSTADQTYLPEFVYKQDFE